MDWYQHTLNLNTSLLKYLVNYLVFIFQALFVVYREKIAGYIIATPNIRLDKIMHILYFNITKPKKAG